MTNELLAANEIMRNNIKKSRLFENLNDEIYNIDTYVRNLEIKLRWNELLCSQEIVNRQLQSFVRISHRS